MWLWFTGKFPSTVCLWQGYMASSDSAFFLPAFSLAFSANLYSALSRPKMVSLLTNAIHSIHRGIPHHAPMCQSARWAQQLKRPCLIYMTPKYTDK